MDSRSQETDVVTPSSPVVKIGDVLEHHAAGMASKKTVVRKLRINCSANSKDLDLIDDTT